LYIGAAALLSLYVFLPQSSRLKASLQTVKTAHPHFLIAAVLLTIATYPLATAIYCLIAYHPIRYPRTLLVQVASSFTNRLLPAGAGGMATIARYLTRNRHTAVQAGSVAALNNLIGVFGHMLILLIIVVFGGASLRQAITVRLSPTVLLVGVLIIATAVTAIMVWSWLRGAVRQGLQSLVIDFRQLWRHPLRLTAAVGSAMLVTSLYALTLYASALALGQHLSLAQVFIVLTLGVGVASITPTPGGIGGAEAGLVAGFVSVGVPADQGLSIALLYRFITYWLPLLPGFIAFHMAARKGYI